MRMVMINLEIFQNGQPIFQSEKRWLLPLFDLEDYLLQHPLDMSTVEVHDKVVGKAAALLMARLGVRRLRAQVLSKLGQRVLEQAGISYTCVTLVERIDCQTEEILMNIDDHETAYRILCQRAQRAP